ncbi:MAG TPA: TIGR02281 family clan AA aspartic protease, partial [Alicycliphilus sp.]|nr:TIGR02281 family clan AA aspartic protease [Alicycliphilus sp.]
MRYPLTCLSTALAFCLPAQVQAQDVALAGILGGKALLVVNGSAPRGVAPGESHMGVQVVSVGREDA